jgi:hypothetical protein
MKPEGPQQPEQKSTLEETGQEFFNWKLATERARETLRTGGFTVGISGTGDGFSVPFFVETHEAQIDPSTGKKFFSLKKAAPSALLNSILDSRGTDVSVGRRFNKADTIRDDAYFIRKETVEGKDYLMLYGSSRDATNRTGFKTIFIGWNPKDSKASNKIAEIFPTLGASSPDMKGGTIVDRKAQLATLHELWRAIYTLQEHTLSSPVESTAGLSVEDTLKKFFGPPSREMFEEAAKGGKVKPY